MAMAQSFVGTAAYMAPEVALRRPYGAASDVFGLGCVLLECLTRQQLRERKPTESRKEYLEATLAAAAKHGWEAHAACADLARRLLEPEPKRRATLLQHELLHREAAPPAPQRWWAGPVGGALGVIGAAGLAVWLVGRARSR